MPQGDQFDLERVCSRLQMGSSQETDDEDEDENENETENEDEYEYEDNDALFLLRDIKASTPSNYCKASEFLNKPSNSLSAKTPTTSRRDASSLSQMPRAIQCWSFNTV
ncbi:hypothetical protein ACLKA6_017545 [Drosophila palustris]